MAIPFRGSIHATYLATPACSFCRHTVWKRDGQYRYSMCGLYPTSENPENWGNDRFYKECRYHDLFIPPMELDNRSFESPDDPLNHVI